MEFGLPRDAGRVPIFAQIPRVSQTHRRSTVAWITRTQHRGMEAAGTCLALLWQFSTLITSTSKNQANGRIRGRILPCSASSPHRHTTTWRAWQGAIKPQHMVCAACLASNSAHYSITWTHRDRLSELLSRMFTLLPS